MEDNGTPDKLCVNCEKIEVQNFSISIIMERRGYGGKGEAGHEYHQQ